MPENDFDERFPIMRTLVRGAASPGRLGAIGRVLARGTAREMAFDESLSEASRTLTVELGTGFLIALVAQFRPEGPVWLETSDPKSPVRHGSLCTGAGTGPLRVHHVFFNSDAVPGAFPVATWRFASGWNPRIDWTSQAAIRKGLTKKFERQASEWAEAHIAALELEPDVGDDVVDRALMFGFSDLTRLAIAHSPLVTPIPARVAA